MTLEIALVMVVVVSALVLFSLEWVPADVTALGLLLVLILGGLLPAKQAFAGFGSDTAIMILGLLVLTVTLLKTGVMDLVTETVRWVVGRSANTLLLVSMLSVGMVSCFMSNTAATAFFLPIAVGVAAKAKLPASRFLMPVAFASILSSSVTLISTSTNLVVSGLMTDMGLAPLGMFELTPVGASIASAGLLYMYFIGRHLIPDRSGPADLIESFGVRSYLTEVLVLPGSRLVGRTLSGLELGRGLDLTVLRIVRGKGEALMPGAGMTVQAGDVLLVEGAREEVLKVKDTTGIEIRPDLPAGGTGLEGGEARLVEALVVPGSALLGRTLRDMGFRQRYGLQVLGLNRHGKNVVRKLAEIPLRVGDVLLVQGRGTNIAALEDERAFSVLTAVEERRLDRWKASRAVLIFAGAVALATSGWVALPVAVMLGVLAVFATGCITPEDAYREVQWRAVILVACLLGLGTAMESTGTAGYLAGGLVSVAGDLNPKWLLAGFFVLTVVLTQPMSNQAAAAVIVPVAVRTALELGLNPRPFAIIVAVAASCSFLTPLEPACLMVYGPGRYRFMDFVKVGAPLTLLVFVLAMVLVPGRWPLQLQ